MGTSEYYRNLNSTRSWAGFKLLLNFSGWWKKVEKGGESRINGKMKIGKLEN